MLLQVSLARPGTPDLRITVEAADGATLGDLMAAYRCVGGGPVTRGPVLVDGVEVPGTCRLGAPPLLDGARLELAAPSAKGSASTIARPTPAGSPPLLHLHVVAGPDAGLVLPVPPGRHTLGRGPGADLVVADAALSRSHATLAAHGQTLRLADLGSTNGTRIGASAEPVGAIPVDVPFDTPILLGHSEIRARTPAWPAAAVRPDGRGHLLVTPGPPPARRHPQDPIAFPEPPTPSPRQRLPLLAATLPLGLSVVLALVLAAPTMLLFGLMSPVLLLGSWLSDRRAGRRSWRVERRRYAVALAAAHAAHARAVAQETAYRLGSDPDPALVASIAGGRLSPLWAREATGPVRLRLGLGRLPAAVATSGPAPATQIGPVPIVAVLDEADDLGIVGPEAATAAVGRWLLGQLAVHHAPTDLRLHRDPDLPGPAWEWIDRLPHAREDAADGPDSPAGRRTVVLTRASGPRAAHPPQPGVHRIVLATTAAPVPPATRFVLHLGPQVATLTDLGEPRELTPDLVPQRWADTMAAALRPLRDTRDRTGADGIPAAVSLLDLLAAQGMPGDPARGLDLAAAWRATPRSTRVPLGVGADGVVALDLAADGPHALVAGTTGSGKSELLVSLVAGLAAGNRPDELAFVLVDYKGGAAFGGCLDLPHVVGLVTDLDQHLTERALTSLTAELRRRERLLAARGCADLTAYQQRWRVGDERLARLVIVVDEFRELAHELPEFVTGLVRIAALGRSLGVHLVVATQRPGGVVTADMRANLGLRIALRVRDVVDSFDVVDSPAAASLPGARPGRAVVTSARRELTTMQTARVTGPRDRDAPPVRVVAVDGLALPAPAAPAGPTDLDLLVAAAAAAALALAAVAPPSPWLPPLPDRVPLAAPGDAPGGAAGGAATGRLVLGRSDHPAEQRQDDWGWDPMADGPLGLAGGPAACRSVVLRALSAAACAADLEVYAVHSGPLADLDDPARWPGVRAAVLAEDVARLVRLIDRLADPARRPIGGLLLVDDWERVSDTLEQARAGCVRERLLALVRAAAELHLGVALGGGRALLAGPVSGLTPRRVLLLPADPVELTLAGVPAAAVPRQPPPGRGIDLRGGVAVQLAVLAADAPPPGLPRPPRPDPAGRIPALPSRITLPECRIRPADLPPGLLPIGTDGTLAVGFLPRAGERRIAVLGEPGSGRTTAMWLLAGALVGAGRRVAFVHGAGMPSPGLRSDRPSSSETAAIQPPAGITELDPTDRDALVALRRRHTDLAVLVDDVGALTGTPVAAVLGEIARIVDADDGLVAVAGCLRDVLDARSPLAVTVAAAGVGLLLGPVAPGEEAALGVRARVWTARHPGRGVLVRHGRATAVQVAEPELRRR